MQHIAIYVRVSSKSQDHRSQRPDLDRWSEAYADIPVKVYKDSCTGKNMDRPGWSRLEKAIDLGKVSKVVVWRLDRLGRTAKGLTALFEKLNALKVGLVSIKDGLDLSTAAGRLMGNVLASVAQYETEVRSERQTAGIAKAKADGKVWGGSEKGRRLSVTDEAIETIRRMSAEGKSKTAMARATGLSRPTIYTVLDRELV